MTRIERWQNGETGEFYEIEWPDVVDLAEPVEAPQLPESALVPYEAPGAVPDGLAAHSTGRRELDPRRIRVLARLARMYLEASMPPDTADHMEDN